ncbi:MAG: hypothetical protein SO053_05715 [Bifidobacterium animalis]|nr:hypothetical protein [Bifidobacterium animalis]MDY5040631.1 hypothetical protein [Bifidobacterium animalis]
MKYEIITDEAELLDGDVAVYAHPSDMKPRLCMRVLAGMGRVAEHAVLDELVRCRDVKLLGPADHHGHAVLDLNDEYAYVVDARSEVFVEGYRFTDIYGNQHPATAFELGYATGRSLLDEV